MVESEFNSSTSVEKDYIIIDLFKALPRPYEITTFKEFGNQYVLGTGAGIPHY